MGRLRSAIVEKYSIFPLTVRNLAWMLGCTLNLKPACRWFDPALGHQIAKPLILYRIRGFSASEPCSQIRPPDNHAAQRTSNFIIRSKVFP